MRISRALILDILRVRFALVLQHCTIALGPMEKLTIVPCVLQHSAHVRVLWLNHVRLGQWFNNPGLCTWNGRQMISLFGSNFEPILGI